MAVSCGAMACLCLSALAQGPVLSLQPGPTVQTQAGNGTLGYSGDGSAATGATLALPSAVAYDQAGDLYIADTGNNVIRKVAASGIVTTVAGSEVQGFGGDGGPATAALLDTPTGIAIDARGDLFIADSHNQRIRMVNAQGIISTVAGNGVAGYSGDGGAAASASLFLPRAVAVDAAGDLYIADAGNNRIRKVSNGIISTVAGDGEQGYSGDGAAAISAGLDTPTGVAVDGEGNLYIADSHDQRIRMVNAQGVISTVGGDGTLGFSGDSGSAAQATLARPTGVAVDAMGNIYIADIGNNVLREISNGVINTIAGDGDQGFGGDNGAALNALLNAPRSVALDPSGNIAIADRLNQRVRAVKLEELTFGSQVAGTTSSPQSVTLLNRGGASLKVETISLTGDFSLASGGSCGQTPITVAPGANCSVDIAFRPVAAGAASGSAVFNGAGITPQTVLLSGEGTVAPERFAAAIALNEAPGTTVVYGTAVTVTATLTGQNGTPSGSITYTVDGANPQTVTISPSGTAQFTLPGTLPVGTHNILVNYAGDANYTLPASAQGFTLNVTPVVPPSFALQANPSSLSVVEGQAGSSTLKLIPSGGYSGTVTFTCSNLPANAACSFGQNPVQLTGDNQPVNVALTIRTNVQQALAGSAPGSTPNCLNPMSFALAFWWPGGFLGFAATRRRKKLSRTQQRWLQLCLLFLFTGALAVGLSGCGGGGFGPYVTPPGSTTVTVTASAVSGTTTMTQTVTLDLKVAQ